MARAVSPLTVEALVAQVLTLLPTADACSVARVSHAWNRAARADANWRSLDLSNRASSLVTDEAVTALLERHGHAVRSLTLCFARRVRARTPRAAHALRSSCPLRS